MIINNTARWTLGDEEYVRLLSEERLAVFNEERSNGPKIVEIEIELLGIIGEEKLNELMEEQESIWKFKDGVRVLNHRPGMYYY